MKENVQFNWEFMNYDSEVKINFNNNSVQYAFHTQEKTTELIMCSCWVICDIVLTIAIVGFIDFVSSKSQRVKVVTHYSL